MGCASSDKSSDFGDDRDHDVDPGIFEGIFTTLGRDNRTNVAGRFRQE